jgi:hypothetical protein
MISCPACKAENPPGSKFCAGCGGALPKTPVSIRCAACGAESPEGSRFCKGCGRPAGATPVSQQGQPWQRSPGGGPGAGGAVAPKATSQAMQRIKMLLGGGAALYALAIFLMYSQVSQLRAMYGAYAGAMGNSGLLWFLIVLDAALACLNVYAISLIGKGDHKYAKWLFVAMAVLGTIFLLRGLSGPVIYIFLNAGLLAGGVYGWILVSREDKGLSV